MRVEKYAIILNSNEDDIMEYKGDEVPFYNHMNIILHKIREINIYMHMIVTTCIIKIII